MAETPLEKILESIMKVFRRYAIQVNSVYMLSNGKMKQLPEKEMPNFLKKNKASRALFEELDKNKDQQVSFDEFLALTTRVLTLNNDDIN